MLLELNRTIKFGLTLCIAVYVSSLAPLWYVLKSLYDRVYGEWVVVLQATQLPYMFVYTDVNLNSLCTVYTKQTSLSFVDLLNKGWIIHKTCCFFTYLLDPRFSRRCNIRFVVVEIAYDYRRYRISYRWLHYFNFKIWSLYVWFVVNLKIFNFIVIPIAAV